MSTTDPNQTPPMPEESPPLPEINPAPAPQEAPPLDLPDTPVERPLS